MEWINAYLISHGFLFLFVVVLLEYLNLPGFPSGIIMTVGGVWIYSNGLSLVHGLCITVLAGLVGSWILYFVGRTGGDFLLNKYIAKFPKQKGSIDKIINLLERNSNWAIFVSKLLPVTRTIMPIPAGAIKLNFINYTLYSALGIFVWNSVLMMSGYYFGEVALYGYNFGC
ncbi:MAG: alkaline phosphatase [Epulopiscium sp. Nuni2H_MBin001]|nr:MAG: alkaline phosphatase [Epulopiscium sp. Nuni2H_MBin001]